MRSPVNQLGTGALSPAVQAWLRDHGAVFARVGADGVVEFSRRPLGEALTDAALDLLPGGGCGGCGGEGAVRGAGLAGGGCTAGVPADSSVVPVHILALE